MAPKCLTQSLQRLTRGMAAELLGELSDQRLIELFLEDNNEAAFEAMVCRHGPMAYRVCWGGCGRRCRRPCRPILAAGPAQARFVSGSRWPFDPWAYRTALALRSQSVLRRRHETLAGSCKTLSCHDDGPDQVLAMLDAEIVRLPERWRLPVLLHYFEGRSQEEAARELRWSKNTFRRRLDKARGSLAMRLRRQGVDWPLAPSVLAAGWLVPKELLAPVVGPAAPLSRRLSGCVLTSRFFGSGSWQNHGLGRLKFVAGGLLGIVLFTGGASLLVHHVLADGPAALVAEPRSPAERPTRAAAKVETPVEPDDQAPSVKNSQPVIVRTEPQAGDTKVDAAAVTEIKVTFSKEMKNGSWSWSQISKETFPQTTGKPHYDKDQRTCILPVKLEAGKTYVLWLNPPRFQGFVDLDGNAAAFYPLVFETKP